jgi:hypothetical protein
MTAPLRVHAFTRKVPAGRGYVGYDEVHIQQLQAHRCGRWITIAEEEVPAAAKISAGCFGDTGGWISKFAALGEFGRDGLIRPTVPGTSPETRPESVSEIRKNFSDEA